MRKDSPVLIPTCRLLLTALTFEVFRVLVFSIHRDLGSLGAPFWLPFYSSVVSLGGLKNCHGCEPQRFNPSRRSLFADLAGRCVSVMNYCSFLSCLAAFEAPILRHSGIHHC